MQTPKNMLCIVICFNPDDRVLKNLERHTDFFESISIIDNSEVDNSELFCHIENIRYYPMYENLGTAKALNWIIRQEVENFDIFAIFDQDSKIMSCDMIAAEEMIFKKPIEVLYPSYFMSDTLNMVHAKRIGSLSLPFMSGLLIRTTVFQTGIEFNEEFFLDYVDFDFDVSLNARKINLCEFEGYVLEHHLGNLQRHYLLGRTWVVTNHNLWRRTSIMKNRLKMYKKYFGRNNRWILYDIKSMIYETLCIIMFEGDKRRKLFACVSEIGKFLSREIIGWKK